MNFISRANNIVICNWHIGNRCIQDGLTGKYIIPKWLQVPWLCHSGNEGTLGYLAIIEFTWGGNRNRWCDRGNGTGTI